MVAARCPRADVPTRLRRLPDPRPTRVSELPEPALGPGGGSPGHVGAVDSLSSSVPSMTAAASESPMTVAAAESVKSSAPCVAVVPQPALRVPLSPSSNLRSRATKVQALSEHSYRVVFTASQRLKEKLDRAGMLLSHTMTPSDLPALLERAVDLLLEREERRRYGSSRRAQPVAQGLRRSTASSGAASTSEASPASTSEASLASNPSSPDPNPSPPDPNPRSPCPDSPAPNPPDPNANPNSSNGTRVDVPSEANHGEKEDPTSLSRLPSRYLPVGVRRQVWERDGGQCSYVDAGGRRCQSRDLLEFDHRVAHALGGAPTVDNIRLRCRSHNLLAAEQVFGSERIAAAISSAHGRCHRPGTTPLRPQTTPCR